MRNSVIGVAINIIMNIILSRFFGIAGLAIATSVSAIVTSLLLWFDCAPSLPCGPLFISGLDLFKTIIATTISIMTSAFLFQCINTFKLLELVIVVFTSAVIYCILGGLLRIELFKEANRIILKKIKKS